MIHLFISLIDILPPIRHIGEPIEGSELCSVLRRNGFWGVEQ
jgi:hypothetical protein